MMSKILKKILMAIDIVCCILIVAELCGFSIICGNFFVFQYYLVILVASSVVFSLCYKKIRIVVLGSVFTCFLIFWSQFNIGNQQVLTKSISPDGKNLILITEYDKPIGGGVNVYRQLVANIYIRVCVENTQVSYHPFTVNDGYVEWDKNSDQAIVRFKRSNGCEEYQEIVVVF